VDVDYAQAAEIAILGAEGAVGDGDVRNQFRTERFERAQITLAVALRALVLLHVIHQHFEAAVDAAVIQVEAEAPDLQRFAAAFMLAGVDRGIELLQHLVIAREQCAIDDFGVAQVDARLHGFGGDDDALVPGGDLRERDVLNGQLARQFQAQADGGQCGGFGFDLVCAIGGRHENVAAFRICDGGGVVVRGFQRDGGSG
jgi:hypothetical protein